MLVVFICLGMNLAVIHGQVIMAKFSLVYKHDLYDQTMKTYVKIFCIILQPQINF